MIMKILLSFLCGMAVVLFIGLMIRLLAPSMPMKPVKLLKATTDSRGYTSVVYKQGRDTLALDYLTVEELDSLVSVGR